jgi:hypothetical protein
MVKKIIEHSTRGHAVVMLPQRGRLKCLANLSPFKSLKQLVALTLPCGGLFSIKLIRVNVSIP